MVFKIFKTSDRGNVSEVEINSIEELIEIVEKENIEIVVGKFQFDCDEGNFKKDDLYIEIYDDYRE